MAHLALRGLTSEWPVIREPVLSSRVTDAAKAYRELRTCSPNTQHNRGKQVKRHSCAGLQNSMCRAKHLAPKPKRKSNEVNSAKLFSRSLPDLFHT